MKLSKLQKYQRAYWKKHSSRIRAELRTTPAYRYQTLKNRCKKNGVKFRISLKVYKEMLEGGCYYCGAMLDNEIGGGVDRRNNLNRNYTTLNLVACCSDCNRIKHDRLTEDEMLVGMKAIVNYRKSKEK